MHKNTSTASGPILLMIRSLEMGGAERQMVVLAKELVARRRDVRLVIFYDRGVFINEVRAAGIKIIGAQRGSRWDLVGQVRRLWSICKAEQPSVVYSFCDLANIFSVTLKPAFPKLRLVWGIRASNLDRTKYDRASRLSYRLERSLAFVPDAIVANSKAGRDFAIRHGYPSERMKVIPNGIDVNTFHNDPAARVRIRAEWGLREDELLIGIVGRIDPMKDHDTFLRAASLVASRHPDAQFVSVGSGVLADHVTRVRETARSLGLADRMHWVDSRTDMTAVYSALDVLCSSSITEGFCNVIAEAMACSVPCVVTDVGDSRWIVEDTGIVVPPRDPQALADGIEELIDRGLTVSGAAARCRICENFSVAHLVDSIEDVLGVGLVAPGSGGASA